MKNKIKYLRKFLKVLIWPIIFVIGSFIINYTFVAIYNYNNYSNVSSNELLEIVKTVEYQNKLNNYINSKTLIMMIILFIVFIPIFYKVSKKYKKKSNIKLNSIIVSILFGISISLIYNICLFNINNIVHITNNFEVSSISIITQIICTGIIGPIIEEYIFRGIIYNKLKEFNKPMKSIILASIIFALFHDNIINAIYAFGVSFIFIYLYEKTNSLLCPIIMHISLNTTIILMLRLIIKNYFIFNLFLIFISIIILLLLRKYEKLDICKQA